MFFCLLALFLGAVDLEVVALVEDDVGVVVWASMPGALGASARSLPTFLVPDTGAVLVVEEELVVEDEVVAGVVCACVRVAQPSKVANRKSVFIEAR